MGDHVFLKIAPWEGCSDFGKEGKLSPKFIHPFEIPERIGLVAYIFTLQQNLYTVHNALHVSMLRKYTSPHSRDNTYDTLPLREDLTYKEESV